MANEYCPKCGYKQLRARADDFICNRCTAVFDSKKQFVGYSKKVVDGVTFTLDENGNYVHRTVENDGKFITYKEIYVLEEGKTTLRGERPKLRKDCPFSERLDCNNGIGYKRCEYMEFVFLGNWRCSYNKRV